MTSLDSTTCRVLLVVSLYSWTCTAVATLSPWGPATAVVPAAITGSLCQDSVASPVNCLSPPPPFPDIADFFGETLRAIGVQSQSEFLDVASERCTQNSSTDGCVFKVNLTDFNRRLRNSSDLVDLRQMCFPPIVTTTTEEPLTSVDILRQTSSTASSSTTMVNSVPATEHVPLGTEERSTAGSVSSSSAPRLGQANSTKLSAGTTSAKNYLQTTTVPVSVPNTTTTSSTVTTTSFQFLPTSSGSDSRLPLPSGQAVQNGQSSTKSGQIAGAVIGSVVGLFLLVLVVVLACHRSTRDRCTRLWCMQRGNAYRQHQSSTRRATESAASSSSNNNNGKSVTPAVVNMLAGGGTGAAPSSKPGNGRGVRRAVSQDSTSSQAQLMHHQGGSGLTRSDSLLSDDSSGVRGYTLKLEMIGESIMDLADPAAADAYQQETLLQLRDPESPETRLDGNPPTLPTDPLKRRKPETAEPPHRTSTSPFPAATSAGHVTLGARDNRAFSLSDDEADDGRRGLGGGNDHVDAPDALKLRAHMMDSYDKLLSSSDLVVTSPAAAAIVTSPALMQADGGGDLPAAGFTGRESPAVDHGTPSLRPDHIVQSISDSGRPLEDSLAVI